MLPAGCHVQAWPACRLQGPWGWGAACVSSGKSRASLWRFLSPEAPEPLVQGLAPTLPGHQVLCGSRGAEGPSFGSWRICGPGKSSMSGKKPHSCPVA